MNGKKGENSLNNDTSERFGWTCKVGCEEEQGLGCLLYVDQLTPSDYSIMVVIAF